MADVTARMLALLSTLQTGRPFSGDELTRRLGVSPRTLRRDVDRLRGYGYPVETQPGPGGYYRLAAGRTMPPLVLDDDEAVATLLALASLAAVGPASGSAAVGSAAVGPATVGSARVGSDTDGSGTGGSGAAGSGTAGSGTAGSGTAGSRAAGSRAAGSRAAGSGTVGPSGEVGIDDAATRAYGKVDQFLPARLRGRAASVRSSLETSRQPAPSVTTEQLALVAEAIAHLETISFNYENARGARALRRVEPYRQVHHMLRWYLLAWDLEREDWRVFRLDRMTDLLRSGTPYEPRPLPAESASDYLRQGLNRHKQTISLVIDAPAAAVMDALRYQDAEIQSIDARQTNVTLAVDSWQWLVLNLAFLDADFHFPANTPFTPACQTFAHRLLTATTP